MKVVDVSNRVPNKEKMLKQVDSLKQDIENNLFKGIIAIGIPRGEDRRAMFYSVIDFDDEYEAVGCLDFFKQTLFIDTYRILTDNQDN